MLIEFIYLFLAGLVGGYIAGLVGIGGGVVYVFIIPIALRYIGVPESEIVQYTVANSTFAILFASASSNLVLIRNNLFHRKEVLIISFLGIVSSVLSLHYIVYTPWYSVRAFNLIVIVLLAYMLYTTLVSLKRVYVVPIDSLKEWKLSLVGAAGGSISALSGMGGGIVFIPILNSFMKIDMKKASAISSGVIMVTAFIMTIFNLFKNPGHELRTFSMGYIVFPIALTISFGVILSSPFGVKAARKMSSQTISYIYASFLGFVIIKKIIELIYYYYS